MVKVGYVRMNMLQNRPSTAIIFLNKSKYLLKKSMKMTMMMNMACQSARKVHVNYRKANKKGQMETTENVSFEKWFRINEI